MLRDAAITIIKQRCGNRADLDLDNLIVTEMQLTQATKLEGDATLPWFLVSELETASTVVDEPRVALPLNFLREHEEGGLWIYRADNDEPWMQLDKGDWSVRRALNSASTAPESFSVMGDYFYLTPTPDAVYALKMYYYKRGLSLADNIENVWLKWMPDRVIAEVGFVIAAQYLKDEEAAAAFAAQIAEAQARWQRVIEAREHAGRSYTMGERP